MLDISILQNTNPQREFSAHFPWKIITLTHISTLITRTNFPGLQLGDQLDAPDRRGHRAQGGRGGQAYRRPGRQGPRGPHQEGGRHALQRPGLRRVQSARREAATHRGECAFHFVIHAFRAFRVARSPLKMNLLVFYSDSGNECLF